MTMPAGLGRTTPPRDSLLWWFYSAPVTLQELQDLYIHAYWRSAKMIVSKQREFSGLVAQLFTAI